MQQDISSNNKRIAKNTVMLYFRMLLIMVVSLYTSRVVLNVLGVEDFGIYNVVGGVVSMLAFFNNSMATSTQRFLNVEMGRGNVKTLNKVFVSAVNAHYMIALLTIIAVEMVGLWLLYNKLTIPSERFSASLWVFHISIATLFVNIISTPYNATIIAHEKMSVFAYFSILEVLLKLLIVYLLVKSPIDKLITYVVFVFFISLFMRGCYIVYCHRNFNECAYKWDWDTGTIRKMFSFTGWMIFGCLSSMLSNQGVNLLINMFFGPLYNAARGIAVQVKAAVDSFVLNFMTAVKPQIMKTYSVGDYNYMYKLVFSSSRMSYYLLFIISLPVLLNTHYMLALWLKIVPPYCELFTQLTLAELLIRTIYTPIAQINQAAGNIRNYQVAISTLFLLEFGFCYVAYRIGSPVYSAFVVAIALAVLGLFVRLAVLQHDNQFPSWKYIKSVLMPIIPVTLLSLVIPFLFHYYCDGDSLLSLVISSFLCVASPCIFIWFFGLDKGEKNMIKGKIQSIISKRGISI